MERGAEPTDLRELVTSAVDKIALAAEAQSVQIVQDVPKNLMIPLDRQRILRVFVNLLVNARWTCSSESLEPMSTSALPWIVDNGLRRSWTMDVISGGCVANLRH